MTLTKSFKFICISCLLAFLSCKEKLSWNLKRSSYNDSKQNVKEQQFKVYNCESYTDFEFIVNGSPSNWQVTPYGYIGSGFALLGNQSSTKVLLNTSCNRECIITFWVKSSNQGYQGVIPSVTINGKMINTSIVKGDVNNWFKIQTSSIPAGKINMEVEFEAQKTIWSYYLDEIELFVSM